MHRFASLLERVFLLVYLASIASMRRLWPKHMDTMSALILGYFVLLLLPMLDAAYLPNLAISEASILHQVFFHCQLRRCWRKKNRESYLGEKGPSGFVAGTLSTWVSK